MTHLNNKIAAFWKKFLAKFFGKHLEFRVRLFNLIATAGAAVSFLMCIVNIFAPIGIYNVILCLTSGSMAVVLLWYSSTSGKYQFCYIITIVIVFFVIFPVFFFVSGGYISGMPAYFIFAVVFTAFMLEGKKMVLIAALEIALYASLFLFAYYNPQYIPPLENEKAVFIDIFASFLFVSSILCITLSLHLRLYILQQRKMKDDLFAEINHEIRTPLTVMTTYAQYTIEQIKNGKINDQTLIDLNAISNESKRLAEMADKMLKNEVKQHG